MRETEWEATVREVEKLLAVPIPKGLRPSEPSRPDGSLDIERMFGVLTRLSVEKDFHLDWVYCGRPHFEGYPVLYCLRTNEVPSDSLDALATYEPDRREFPFHVGCNDSPAGFCELAVFRILGDQFYLYWHANHRRRRIICGEASLARLRSWGDLDDVPESVLTQVRAVDLNPTITVSADVASVGLVWFSRWKGFVYEETVFNRERPQRVMGTTTRVLAEYNCDVIF